MLQPSVLPPFHMAPDQSCGLQKDGGDQSRDSDEEGATACAGVRQQTHGTDLGTHRGPCCETGHVQGEQDHASLLEGGTHETTGARPLQEEDIVHEEGSCQVAQEACRQLREQAMPPQRLWDALTDALKDEDPSIRGEACFCMCCIAAAASHSRVSANKVDATPPQSPMLDSTRPALRKQSAADTSKQAHRDDISGTVCDLVAKYARDSNVHTRRLVLEGLHVLLPVLAQDTARALPVLEVSMEHASTSMRLKLLLGLLPACWFACNTSWTRHQRSVRMTYLCCSC
jgi:hypothetical protein